MGGYPETSLAAARKARDSARERVNVGGDPIADKRPAVSGKPAVIAFRQAVDDYIAAHQASWRNPKHRQQWRNTLDTYVKPLMDMPVEEIDTLAVRSVLKANVETRRGTGELWSTLPETASRLRGRIETVLDSVVARFRESHHVGLPGPGPRSFAQRHDHARPVTADGARRPDGARISQQLPGLGG